MSTVWILGAGQLGAMLRHAGQPLAIDVRPLPLDAERVPETAPGDIVSPEIEHWPDTPATRALAGHPGLVNRGVFARLADRFTQKSLIDELALATAPWCLVETDTAEQQLYDDLGERVLLKQRRGGYDGRGQHWLRRARGDVIPPDWRETAIAESGIDFDEEVSLVGMRDRRGRKAFYPLTLNLHRDGILVASIAPMQRLQPLQARAEAMLGALLDRLDYTGVMAMECFRLGDRLLINELAPRVHNSGHWTQAGATISQFESHLRAICGLPMPTPELKGTTAMINLIGIERDDGWLAVPRAELFWYGKSVRPGRKLGHINCCFADTAAAAQTLDELRSSLPADYGATLDWILDSLAG